MKFALALCVVALCAATCSAWWCTGHMTVAEIARQNLNSDVESTVQSLIASLSQMGPFSRIPDMTQAGCWADDLKYNLRSMEGWHFLNMPYNPSNYQINPVNAPYQKENVGTLITQLDQTIKYQPDNWELTFALGNLIHFYGDIHQPLHVTDYFSSTFPTGDRGGNLFMIYLNGNLTDLHGVWDSICGTHMNDPNRPLDSEGKAKIQNLATQFQNSWASSFSNHEQNVYNSTVMAQESYQYAVEYSYNGIQQQDTLSASYLSACTEAAQKRITLAGLRLANQLNYLFGNNNKPTGNQIRDHIYEHVAAVNKLAREKHADIQARLKQSKH